MARKSKATLDGSDLTDDQRDAVFAHCESVPLEAGVSWLKAEFEIRLSTVALGKWLEKRRIDKGFKETLSEIRADASRAELLSKELGDAAQMKQANVTMLGQALFETLRTKDPKARNSAAKALAMVVGAFSQERDSRAKVIAANTMRDKFQFDSAKSALKNTAELTKINESAGDEREKVERAIKVLFGPEPEEEAAA